MKMMKWWCVFAVVAGLFGSVAQAQSLIISQYVETDSGTTPKGIELWNAGLAPIDFSVTTLDVQQGQNGAPPVSTFTLNSGLLAPGAVWVIGTSDIGAYLDTTFGAGVINYSVKAFNFNGNDSLVVLLGGVTQDVFGTPGSDPGSAWSGNGVSSANQNIQILEGITTGTIDSWTDPSTRFETVSSTPTGAGGLDGFGVAPTGGGADTFVVTLDKADGFAIAEGTSDSITATASNGLEPYEYVWGSTLDGAHFSALDNVFTILDTAPAGSYSATVTVTDDDLVSTNRTINFDVVTAYAITINAGAGGTVSTTPAGFATEGTTVSITSTPDVDFVLGSISVVDEESQPVVLTGNAFVMPASEVTVTVVFNSLPAGLYIVNFEGDGETKTGYASGNVTLSGKDWNLTDALIGTDANDWKTGVRSARMRGYGTSAMTMQEDLTDGLGTISFSYRRYGADTQVDWIVQYSDDGGLGWTDVGVAFTAPESDDVQTFSEPVNIEGNVRVRIKRATEEGTVNQRLNIDDILMTPYDGGVTPVTPVVSFTSASDVVSEAAGEYVVTVTKSPASGDVSGDILLGGTAVEGDDYSINFTNFSMDGATTSFVFTIELFDDVAFTGDREVILTITNLVGATLGANGQFTLTIEEDDTLPPVEPVAQDILSFTVSGGTATVLLNDSEPGIEYVLTYSDSIANTGAWTTVSGSAQTGNDALAPFVDNAATNAARFYRIEATTPQ